MRKSIKLLAAVLSLLMLMTVFAVPALATPADLPNATVEELRGADLVRSVDGIYVLPSGGATVFTDSQYTMTKGVRFTSNDTEETPYDDWICDFVLTLRSPNNVNYIPSDSFLLIGMRPDMGTFGLSFEGFGAAPDGSYQVLAQLMNMAHTYEDIRKIGVFECGIVDISMPEDTEIDIQLMLYPPGSENNRDAMNFITAEPTQVGDTITYAPISIAKIDAYVGSDGLGNLRFVSNVNYKDNRTVEYFGTWFLPENLMATKPEAKVELRSDGAIASGSDFKADLVEIPAKDLDRAITGVSYVKFAGIDTVYTVQETTSVEASKNWTSR